MIEIALREENGTPRHREPVRCGVPFGRGELRDPDDWTLDDPSGAAVPYQPEEVRADNVAALIAEGFSERLLLSEDICMLEHLKFNGGKGYGYLLEIFVPLLRQRGVGDEAIHHRCWWRIRPASSRGRWRPPCQQHIGTVRK